MHVNRLLRSMVALGALAFVGQAAALDDPPHVRRVLELFQGELQASATIAFHAALRNALPPEQEVELAAESLDLARANDPDYRRALQGWLSTRYSSAPPDAIVAVGDGAARFILDSGLWPTTPIVFGLVEGESPLLRALPARITGVVDDFPIAQTVELALRLLPDTRRLVLVGGASAADAAFSLSLRREAGRFRGRLEVVDLIGLPTHELLARLRAMPAGTISMGVSYFVDGAGQRWNGPQIVPVLTQTGLPPTFVLLDGLVGVGAVGGVILDFGDSGRRAAALVRRVLAGEAPATIPVDRGTGVHTVLDARMLQRLWVPDDRVPAGAELRFRQPSPWQLLHWEVLGAVVALVLQATLIVGLLLSWRGRLAAERQARENLAVVAHLNRVGAIGELAGSFAHELNSPLGAVLNNAQAARRFLAQGPEGTEDVLACLDDIVGDARRAGEVVKRMRGALRREDVRQEAVDVAALVRDAVRLVEAEARDRGVALEVAVAADLPALVGDDVQLVQVVLNLVMNAIDALAAVPPEQRHVAVTAVAVREGVEIRVADTGPGVPPAQLEKVFDPFVTSKPGGLGLGLAISRSVVEAHGGSIRTEPVSEGGAVFCVVLPASRERTPHPPQEQAAG
jgi:signal transduction histidine kinase